MHPSIREYIYKECPKRLKCASDENFDEVFAETLKELETGGEELKKHFMLTNFGGRNRKRDA